MENTTGRVLVSSHVSTEVRDRLSGVAQLHNRGLAGELRHIIHQAIGSLKQSRR